MQMQVQRIKKLLRYIRRHNIGIYAANTAFFILLSFFPALMLLLGILHYTPLTQDDFLSAAYALLPELFHPLIEHFVVQLYADSGPTLISLSAVSVSWSASRGVFSLLAGLNQIFHCSETRGYLVQRILCLFYTLLLFAALILTMVVYVFGQRIEQMFAESTVPLLRLGVFLIRLRPLAVTVLLTFIFLIILTVFPNKRQRFRYAFFGAFGAALGWVVFSSLLMFYVDHFSGYSTIYGSLTTVALGMLWLYICVSILFYGALLNRTIEIVHKREKKTATDKK